MYSTIAIPLDGSAFAERALGRLPVVRVVRVETGRPAVAFEPAPASRADITDAVRGAGYMRRWT